MLYTDFVKAFNNINYHILFRELRQIIENRYQIVIYKEFWSILIRATSGVLKDFI